MHLSRDGNGFVRVFVSQKKKIEEFVPRCVVVQHVDVARTERPRELKQMSCRKSCVELRRDVGQKGIEVL